ncbi:MAG: hypothetical protein AB7F88_12190 [Pyrinomonadaceae bacterium]
MIELNNFYNNGFGWICRHCERELRPANLCRNGHSRFMTEGEAEAKQPKLANRALAKWADAAQRTLVCPRCGITELADLA